MMKIANWMRVVILTLVLNGGIKHDDAKPHNHSEVHLVSQDIPNVRKGGPGVEEIQVSVADAIELCDSVRLISTSATEARRSVSPFKT